MKKIVSTAVLLLVFCSTAVAQTMLNQSEELDKLPLGEYLPYLTHKKDDGSYLGGLDNLDYELVFKKPEHNFPKQHFIVKFTDGTNSYGDYLPDDMAFPITYVTNGYEGNQKMQKAIGYAPSVTKYEIPNRLIFLDGKIYVVRDWKSKDDYRVHAVLEQGGKPGTFKMMKLVMKSPKKMKAEDPDKVIADYLAAAYKVRDARRAEFLSNPANKAAYDNMELINKTIRAAMKKQNDDYLKSDEYQRILRNQRIIDQVNSESNATVQNNTGKDIYIYQSGSRNGSRVSANGSSSIDCTESYYYSFSSSSSVNGNGSQFYSANSKCGGTVTVN